MLVFDDSPGTQERGSQSCRGFSSHLWSDVAFDQWSTHECNRALRRAYQMTGRQECLRAVAKSRRDEDRARKLVLPPSSALLHWPSPPLRGFWIFEEFPVHLRFDPLCLAFARLRSRLRILPLLDLSKRVLALPRLRQECRMYLLPPFFEFTDILCQVPCVSAGASLLFQSFVLRSFREFWIPRNSLSRYTFFMSPCDGPFLSLFFA